MDTDAMRPGAVSTDTGVSDWQPLCVPSSAGQTGMRERPVYLPSGTANLFAIVAEPTGPASDLGVVMLHARNRTNTANRNRSGVRLSRAFAERGIRSIRFDFHGNGDSTGVAETGLTRQAGTDVLTAVQHLVEAGCSRIMLTGICYGAMAGLMVAAEIPQLVAMSMMNPPFASLKFPGQTNKHDHSPWRMVLRPVLRGRFFKLVVSSPEYRKFLVHRGRRRFMIAKMRRRTPASPSPIGPQGSGQTGSPAIAAQMTGSEWAVWKLKPLVDRGVSIRMFVDQHEKLYRDFEEFKKKDLGVLIASSRGLIQTMTAPNTRYGMHISLEGQDFVTREVVAWAEELAAGA